MKFKEFCLHISTLFFMTNVIKATVSFARVISVEMARITVGSAAVLLAAMILLCHCPGSCYSAKLPESFPRCSDKQPELNKCLGPAVQTAMTAMKDGIPSHRVPPIDPLQVSSISLELGNNQAVNFKLDMTNASLFGLGETQVRSASLDMQERRYHTQVFLPKLELKGDYEINGKFLLLPLTGKGKFRMEILSTDIDMDITYDEINKSGDVYWVLKPFEIVLKNTKKFAVHFDNLFNGDKILGESTNRVLNENWEILWNELRPNFQDTFGQIFAQIANLIFSRVPIKEQHLH